MKVLQSLFLASIISLFTACGGGGDATTSSNGEGTTTTYLNGVAIDGYIVGATVCIDTTLNNSCDDEGITHKTITDANGSFSFDTSLLSDNSIIIAYEGNDTTTNLPFKHIVKNYASNTSSGKVVLSGLTTLATQYAQDFNVSISDANTKIANYLGVSTTNINADIILSSYTTEYQKNLKLFKIIETINDDGQISFTSGTYTPSQSISIIKAIVNTIENNSSARITDGTITLNENITDGGIGENNVTIVIGNSAPVIAYVAPIIKYVGDNKTVVQLSITDPDGDSFTSSISVNPSSKFQIVETNLSVPNPTITFINDITYNHTDWSHSDNNMTITIRTVDDNTSGDAIVTTRDINIRITTTGHDLYHNRVSKYSSPATISLNDITYTWDNTNNWYATTNTILMPVKRLANTTHLIGKNFNAPTADGHYDINKTNYLSHDRVVESANQNYYDTYTFNGVSGTGLKPMSGNFGNDPLHKLFVSSMIVASNSIISAKTYAEWTDMNLSDSNNTTFVIAPETNTTYATDRRMSSYAPSSEQVDINNDGNITDSYCANSYGEGWRLPTAYEIGIDTDSSALFKGYIPAYMASDVDIETKLFSSSYYNASNNWGIKIISGFAYDYAKTGERHARCVFNN